MKYSLLLLAAAALWSAEESTRTIEKSFPLTGNERRVQICTLSGSIHVTASDSNEVRFSVRERIAAPTRERLEELKKETDVVFAQEPGTVRAGVKGPWSATECGARGGQSRKEDRRRWNWDETRVEHEFTVSVPRDARIELQSVNGGVHATGTTGRYSLSTVNGSIRMNDVEGSGDVKTVNGSVQAVYSRNPNADTVFRTVNGKLDLYFQPSLSADFKVKTVNGKAYTDFDMTSIPSNSTSEAKGMKVIHRRGTSGDLRAGNGGPKIVAETVNGSILIHSLAKGRP
ncbi:MAG: hypothetical protein JNM66_18500 [Bryobacterales bacterium]|nr:hypothetical protein [Bryobacterales bacterium]